MQKIRVFIVEDSSLFAADIAARLQKHGMEVVHICGSGEEALHQLPITTPDLILMDIHLSGALDGISTAALIRKEYSIPIIYLSDYTDNTHVQRARKTFPAAYLSKPFHEPDLIRALEIAFTNTQQTEHTQTRPRLPDHIFVKDGHTYLKVALAEIVYLQADRAYCKIITEHKSITESNSMKHVLQQIQHQDFVQVHRSYAININHITGIDGNIIRLGEHSVEMSHSMREDFMSKLKFLR